MASNYQGDIEEMQAPLSTEAENRQTVSKPPANVWDLYSQYIVWIFTGVAGILIRIQPGVKNIDLQHHFTSIVVLTILMMIIYLFTGGLMVLKHYISGMEKPSPGQKIILMFLNLFTVTAIMAANVVFLGMVTNYSYIQLASVPSLGFILVAVLFYFQLKPDQDLTEDIESKVKNCFKVVISATTTGFAVQTAVIVYLINPKCHINQHDEYCLFVAFLTTVLGSFSSTLTSSPLQFQSELMCRLIVQMPIVMLFLQGLLAVLVSSIFLDPAKEVFAVLIPSIVMFLVNLCQKSSNQQPVAEVDSMFVAIPTFVIGVFSAIYAVKFGSEGSTTYLTYSVFVLLSAIMSSSMRIAIFRPACTVIGHVNDALPMVLTLVGVALLLIEFSTHAIEMARVVPPSPIPGVFSPFPH